MKNFKYILSGFPHPSSLNVGSEAVFKERKKEFLKLIKLWQFGLK